LGGTDTVAETANTSFTLTDGSLVGLGIDTLANIVAAILTGGSGNNTLDASGFSGSVTLIGGNNNDLIDGQSGNDTISGDNGNDTLLGGFGKDSILGGAGNDLVYGGDFLSGGDADKDTLKGQAGFDTLIGDSGFDSLETASEVNLAFSFDTDDYNNLFADLLGP
jgi:Ca2+-binding RTX toxin-like protein